MASSSITILPLYVPPCRSASVFHEVSPTFPIFIRDSPPTLLTYSSPSPVACNASNHAQFQNRCPSSSHSPTRNQGSSVVARGNNGSIAIPQPQSGLAEARRYNEDRWAVATSTKILREGLAGHYFHISRSLSLAAYRCGTRSRIRNSLRHSISPIRDLHPNRFHRHRFVPFYPYLPPSTLNNPLPAPGMKHAQILSAAFHEEDEC